MWVEQMIGPFRKGIEYEKYITFPFLQNLSNNIEEHLRTRYVRLGIQAPQAPYITEARDINYKEKIKDGNYYAPGIIEPAREENPYRIDNTHCFVNGIEIEDGRKYPCHSFKVLTSDGSFIMNPGEVLEFQDLDWPDYFKIVPLQDEDEYTIIEIQYLEDTE